MECLRTLKDKFTASTIEQGIVFDIVAIIYLTRVWVAPYGMLGANHLLREGKTKHLLVWVGIIETCFMFLLKDASEEAFTDYEDYLNYLNGKYF